MKKAIPRIFRSLLAVACLLASLGTSAKATFGDSPKDRILRLWWQVPISSQADLDKVVAQLDQPATRLSALRDLIDFAGLRLYPSGSVSIDDRNPKFNEEQNKMFDGLRNKAIKIVWANTNFATVRAAIYGNDKELRYWGLGVYRDKIWKDVPAIDAVTTTRERLSLLPKIKELATSEDYATRADALEILQEYPEFKSFLADRLEVETGPDIILHLLYHPNSGYDPNNTEFSARFNPYLLKFLNHPDEKVRRGALDFIWFNYFSAPMWKITFDQAIKDKVVEMTKSPSEQEKTTALRALEWMQKKPMDEQ